MVRCKKKTSPTATTLQIPDYLAFSVALDTRNWTEAPESSPTTTDSNHYLLSRPLEQIFRKISTFGINEVTTAHWRYPPNIETALQRNVAVKLHPLFFSHSLEHTHTPTHPTQECKNRPDPPPPPLMLPCGGLAIFSARLMLRRTELKEPLETKQWTRKMHRQRFLLDREIIQNCNTIF